MGSNTTAKSQTKLPKTQSDYFQLDYLSQLEQWRGSVEIQYGRMVRVPGAAGSGSDIVTHWPRFYR